MSLLFINVTAFTILNLIAACTGLTYYITPNSGNVSSSCPELPKSSCRALDGYLGYNFSNSSTVIFCDGHHQLSGSLKIANVHNLTLAGYSNSSIIECHGGNAGIAVINATSVKISGLILTGCGTQHHETVVSAALYWGNIVNASMHHVRILNSKGFGLNADHCTGLLSIQGCVLSDNRGELTTGGNAKFSLNGSNSSDTALSIESSEFANGLHSTSHHSLEDSEASGITVYSHAPGVKIELNNVTLRNNSGGNLKIVMYDFVDQHWHVSILNSHIEQGSTYYSGGGMFFTSKWPNNDYTGCTPSNGNKLLITSTNFTNNTARLSAGGLKVELFDSDCMPSETIFSGCWFVGNTVASGGHAAAIKVLKNDLPAFYKYHNSIGFPLHNLNVVNCHFLSNHISGSQSSVVKLDGMKKTTVTNSTFQDNNGTAISMRASNVIFDGTTVFKHNRANDGGALKLCDSSLMFFGEGSTVVFEENHAYNTGGAIFAQEPCLDQPSTCFFQPILDIDSSFSDMHINLFFINNSADSAGNAVYGGRIGLCHTYSNEFSSAEVFKKITTFTPRDEYGAVSSDPYQVLLCDQGQPTKKEGFDEPISVIPGKRFNIGVAAAGQNYGIAPATITAAHSSDNTSLHTIAFLPSSKCSNLTLNIWTGKPPGSAISLVLRVQHTGSHKYHNRSNDKVVTLLIQHCPWGFGLKCTNNNCVCQCFFDKDDCSLEKLMVHRMINHGTYNWVGCQRGANDSISCKNKSFIHSYNCGKESYCRYIIKDDHLDLLISEDNVDSQCSEGRTGILCGSCVKGLSVVLGTGDCKRCPASNVFLSLIVVYLLSGVILIVVLTKLKLIVTCGSMNGLILYASFMHWNRHYLFPNFVNYDILRLFIAWLNLDHGIEICFFDGMTALHVLWLQISYILYIFLLQLIIAVLCRKYVTFTRFFGRNVTKVMSTLFILSFFKVLQIMMDIFEYNKVYDFTSRSHFNVLSIDGDIGYWSRQHIPLFVVGILLSILWFIFIISLLFFQLLIRISSVRCFKWVARLQPFYETITGPCNTNYTFWPGFLFLVRFLSHMFLYSFRSYGKEQLSLTSSCALFILIFSFLGPKGVYKKWSLNILELSFWINLSVTCLLAPKDSATTRSRISVAIAIALFLGHHLRMHLLARRFATFVIQKLGELPMVRCSRTMHSGRGHPTVVSQSEVAVSPCSPNEHTPLLPPQVMPQVIDYRQFREPLLENTS